MTRIEQEALEVGRASLGLRRTSGRGHPVIMLHGLMDCAESWDPFAQALSRPTYALDLPGFGQSTLAGDDLGKWQRLFRLALDELGVDNCFLLGHSLGGALGSAMAAADPDRFRALLLIAPAGYSRIPLAQILARPEMEFLLGRTAPQAMRFRPIVNLAYRQLFAHGHDLSDELGRRLVESRSAMVPGIRMGMHILRELSKNPFRESPFEGPVAGLWGEHDRMVPPKHSLKGLLKVFPEAEGEIFEDIGHHPQEELPARTLEWITEWTDSAVREPMILSSGEPFG
jgi:pyruvate dehydrogenase E2 component (dihydrolipoamide acetyltransferase)